MNELGAGERDRVLDRVQHGQGVLWTETTGAVVRSSSGATCPWPHKSVIHELTHLALLLINKPSPSDGTFADIFTLQRFDQHVCAAPGQSGDASGTRRASTREVKHWGAPRPLAHTARG